MSWLSSIIRAVPYGAQASDASAAIFNTKKTPQGQVIDTQAISNEVAAQLQQSRPVQNTNIQGQMILGGAALLALVLLLKKKP